jgi:RecA/RadA recombinase
MDIQINAAQVEAQAKAFEWDLMEERINEHTLDMTKELPELHPLISIGGSCVCSRGNISAICGEAKSKKTFLASALVASAMAMPSKRIDNFANVDKNMDMRVLWIDTEQGEMHVRRVVERISEMTGAKLGGVIAEPRLTTLLMRELAPMERYNLLVDAIYHNIKVLPFDLIVIDGIADLQRNTNDLEESDALVGALMRLSTQTNTHIICVLHTNPGTDKARGHLGSSLQRKAESVIFVHRVGECSIVEPQFCRNEPFERFAFTISERGIPQLCDLPGEGSMKPNDLIVQLLNTEYAGSIERTTLVNKVAEMLNMSKNTARMRVSRLIDKGILFINGNMVSSNWEAEHKNTKTRTNGLCDDVRDVCDVRGAETQTCVCAGNSDNDDCPF